MENGTKSRGQRQKNSKKKWILRSIIAIILIIGAISSYAFYKINSTMDKMYEPVQRETSNVSPNEKPDNVTTILVLGNDSRSGSTDRGRTDVIMLAVINDTTKKITLTSIPRDTYVEIAGKNKKDKINSAYGSGIGTTIATVENFTNIPIDHYVLFNFEGFKTAIDSIGKIKVDVDHSVYVGIKKQFPEAQLPGEGMQALTGEQALYFSRFRYDAKGDFGRNERQQKVLKAFLDQSKSVRSPKKINGLLEAIGQDVRTDLTNTQIYSLALDMNGYSSNQVEQIKYKATTGPIGKISYVFISDEERSRVTSTLKEKINSK